MQFEFDIREASIKAGLTGLLYWGTAMTFYGETGTLDFAGIQIPSAIPLIGAGAGSSLVADFSHKYIYPMMSQDAKLANVESAVTGMVVAGASTAAILKVATGMPLGNVPQAALLGAIVFAASDSIYYNIVSKKNRGILV